MNTKRVNTLKRKRVGVACSNCQRSHLSCDNVRPCLRCDRKGLGHMCVDGEQRRRGKKPRFGGSIAMTAAPSSLTPLRQSGLIAPHTRHPSSYSHSRDEELYLEESFTKHSDDEADVRTVPQSQRPAVTLTVAPNPIRPLNLASLSTNSTGSTFIRVPMQSSSSSSSLYPMVPSHNAPSYTQSSNQSLRGSSMSIEDPEEMEALSILCNIENDHPLSASGAHWVPRSPSAAAVE